MEECAKHYEINEFRKNNLLKLRKYLKDSLLDQIPVLVHLKKSLEQLSVMNVQSSFKNNPFIITNLTQLKKGILESLNLGALLKDQTKTYSAPFTESERKHLDELNDIFVQGFEE